MPNKLVTAWKAVGGTVTPSIRELAAAYDNVMPLILAAGAAIGPTGLAIAQGINAETDNEKPLNLARFVPGNIFPVTFLPSLIAACTQLSAMFLSTFTPPTPAQALAAWQATPMGAITTPGGLLMTNAMAIYLSSAFIGGVGNPADAPPPPTSSDVVPYVSSGHAVAFRYETSADDPALGTHQVHFYPFTLPDNLVYCWSFVDGGGASIGTTTGASPVFTFPAADFYDVTMIAVNGAGNIQGTRNIYSD